jgi:hypothetical protein
MRTAIAIPAKRILGRSRRFREERATGVSPVGWWLESVYSLFAVVMKTKTQAGG